MHPIASADAIFLSFSSRRAGLDFYLSKYAGNLDIMILAALRTAECLVGARVN
jgi:acetaldehyde dehydrogenase (acetylating)